jgi:hypothetical protein
MTAEGGLGDSCEQGADLRICFHCCRVVPPRCCCFISPFNWSNSRLCSWAMALNPPLAQMAVTNWGVHRFIFGLSCLVDCFKCDSSASFNKNFAPQTARNYTPIGKYCAFLASNVIVSARQSPFPVQQTQSAFHRHAQRNAFRRDAVIRVYAAAAWLQRRVR